MNATMNKSETVTVGTRLYNGGDMANAAHFGTVTEIIPANQWGAAQFVVTPDAGSDRTGAYRITAAMVSPVYLGHGGTRIVTEEAYRAFREAQMAAFRARMAVQP